MTQSTQSTNLIQSVRELLTLNGLEKNARAHFDTDSRLANAKDMDPISQRTALNRYWTLQLLAASEDATEQRFCLTPGGTCEEWLALFKGKIIPFLVSNNLPTAL